LANTRKPKDPGDGDEYHKPEPHKEQSGSVQVHQAYLEHRLAGGEPATPEAFRRAVEQFEKLAGAVRSLPPAVAPDRPSAETGRRQDDKDDDDEGDLR
jgi:hypothetical protein